MPEKIPVINPATEEIIDEIEVDSLEKVKGAVANARKAFPIWCNTILDDRIQFVKQLIPIIEDRKDELALTITKDMGKPISLSKGEVDKIIGTISFYTDNIKDFLKEEIVYEREDEKDIIVYEPLGVVAIITPWNYPLSTVFSPLIPALLCGNTVVVKPSEQTLMVGKKIKDLFLQLEKKDFPKNVFNLVLGDKETGRQLVQQNVDMVSFTGSIRAGKEIMKDSADKLHKLVFELGGKDPAIVCSDADIGKTAKFIVRDACRNTGQVCCIVERVYVIDDVYDEFVKKAIEEAKAIKIGNPEKEDTEMGPFVAKFQKDTVVDHINEAVKNGAKIEFGGDIEDKGYFFKPTILTNVNHSMKIMVEETFGPVVPIMKVSSEEEAIKLANDTVYGLTGSVWTQNIEKGNKIAKQLQVGVAAVNEHGGGKQGSAWGGAKMSGIGRLGSKEGTHTFTNIKTLRVNKKDLKSSF